MCKCGMRAKPKTTKFENEPKIKILLKHQRQRKSNNIISTEQLDN